MPANAAVTPPITVPYLMVATMVSVVASTIYVPSLPSIAVDLQTSPALAQFSLTAFILTFGVVQLWHGPASDRLGRWRVLAGSLVLFVIGTAACALAPTIELLIAGRVLQGLGAAGVAVKGEGCRAAGGRGEPVLRTARRQEVAFLEPTTLAVLVNAIDQLTADQVDTNYGRF